MEQTWLELAIQAVRQGDVDRGRELLRGYVRYYPRDEVGWLWLSRTEPSRAEKLKYLQRGIAVSPQNGLLRSEYAKLTASEPPISSPPRKPRYTRAVVVARADWLRRAFEWNLLMLSFVLVLVVAAATTPAFLGNRLATSEGALIIAHLAPLTELELGDEILYDVASESGTPAAQRIVGIEQSRGVQYLKLANDEQLALPRQVWRINYKLPLIGYAIDYVAAPAVAGMLLFVALLALSTLKILERYNKRQISAKIPQRRT